MRWSIRRMAVVLLGVAALVIAAIAINGSGSAGGGLDKYSYTKGYDAFGGAYIPTDTRGREEVEADCASMYRERGIASPDHKLVEGDWVQGCADAAQNKDSRF